MHYNKLMNHFESGVQENPQEASLLEKTYKSKITRSLVLMMNLSFLGQMGCMESRHKEQHSHSEIADARKVFDPGELSEKITMYSSRAGDKYVMSIGQIHSDVMLEPTVEGFNRGNEGGVKDLIENQKNIEALVDPLASKYGVPDVDLEKTPSTWGIEELRELKKSINDAKSPQEKLTTIQRTYDALNESTLIDCEKGPVLYLLLYSLNNLDSTILSQREMSVRDSLVADIGKNPLIKDENVYIWGGAIKSFVEGKVDIKLADDEHAFEKESPGAESFDMSNDRLGERLKAVRMKAEEIAKEKEFVKQGNITNNVREDVAIAMIGADARKSSQTIYPVIYGVAHEFTDNVIKYDKEHGANLGIINVYDAPRSGSQ